MFLTMEEFWLLDLLTYVYVLYFIYVVKLNYYVIYYICCSMVVREVKTHGEPQTRALFGRAEDLD